MPFHNKPTPIAYEDIQPRKTYHAIDIPKFKKDPLDTKAYMYVLTLKSKTCMTFYDDTDSESHTESIVNGYIKPNQPRFLLFRTIEEIMQYMLQTIPVKK